MNYLSGPKVDVFKKCVYSNGFIVSYINSKMIVKDRCS